MHTCACFMHIYGCFHRICCLTSPHTSIQKGGGASRRLHKGGQRFAPPPPLWIPFWMDVCGLVLSLIHI